MPSWKNSLFIGFLALTFLLTPQVSFAAATATPTCTCFCGTSSTGAVAEKSPVKDSSTCSATCNKNKTAFVGCYIKEGDFPVYSDKCWTEDECKNELGSPAPAGSGWAGQNAYCSKSLSGAAMGSCYGETTPVNLNITLLGKTTVTGLPEYIALAYKFLLPAFSLVAVVMIMIGGVQYATSRGNAKAVGQAKERISNALIGLVLLLCVYVIANILDPRLLFFDNLRVPMMKKAILLDATTSCEALLDYGYEISPSGGACGEQGKVTSIEKVDKKVANSNFKVGSSCDWGTCVNGEACTWTASGNVCVSCGQAASYVTINKTVCESFAASASTIDIDPKHKHICLYKEVGNTCAEVYTSGDGYINCGALKANLKTGDDPCSAYDALNIGGVATVSIITAPLASLGKEICEADYCGLASATFKKCVFTPPTSSDWATCRVKYGTY